MSLYGIDGEDAFSVIASSYISSFPTKSSERLSEIHARGKAIATKYGIRADHMEETHGITEKDAEGEMLPILYQHFLSKRFRETSGKFFTPKPIAKSMAHLLIPFEDAMIVDPCCGSGTFLRAASETWGNMKCQLVGNDIDPLLIDLTELSLSMTVPSHQSYRLLRTNMYEPHEEITGIYGKADYILANPPFSIPVHSFYGESELYELGYRNSDALFLDLAHRLLKPSGRLVCLLPHSIVTNDEYIELRQKTEERWFLLGVVTLPEGVFYTTAKTSTRADILVLEKMGDICAPEKSFFCHVSSVGVPLRNHSKGVAENQLVDLVSSKDIQDILTSRRT